MRLLSTAAWGETSGRVSVGMVSIAPILRELARTREGFTPMNALTIDKRMSVLHLLIEGNSIRSTERLTGVHRDTIMGLLVVAGNYTSARSARPGD
jgi:hypothetical protein